MCSVVGFSGEFKSGLVQRVLAESRCRGVHAFGYSYYIGGRIETKKFFCFKKFLGSILATSPNKFIAHFRYSTSGDWCKLENNQPLEFGDIALAFNGVISQKKKTDMEAEFGIEMPFENDGFILADSILKGKDLGVKGATFACCYLRGGKVYARRNKLRPLYLHSGKDFSIVASTKDILKRSGVDDVKIIDEEISF